MITYYVIEFDNGQSYEDHRTEVALAASTPERAAAVVDELNTWLERQRLKYPNVSFDLPDDDWVAADVKRRKKISSLRCPYSLNTLLRAEIQNGGSGRFHYFQVMGVN